MNLLQQLKKDVKESLVIPVCAAHLVREGAKAEMVTMAFQD